jgi:hypothetical protein
MRVLFLLLLATQAFFPEAHAADCLKIGVASGGLTSAAVARITDEIFTTAGSCAEIISAPSNRLTALTDTDALDGEAFKITDYIEGHADLMAVPTAVQHLTGALFWPGDAAEPAGPAATIGVLLGQIWPRRAALEQGAAFFEVRGYDQMIEMTRSGRLQGFMMAAEALDYMRPRYDYLGDYKTKKVADIPLHLAVKRRYAALVPALDNAIRKMVASGQIERELKAEDR